MNNFIFETFSQLKEFVKLNSSVIYGQQLNDSQLHKKAMVLWNDLKGNESINQFITDSDILDLYNGWRRYGN